MRSMTFKGIPVEAFEFYEGLQADNSKAYWTQHKSLYEDAVRGPLIALVADLEHEFGPAQLFRPHRDVRFSADKSPYKTHQGAFCELASGIGFYVQLDADGLMTAAGFHTHSTEQTARYRRAVDDETAGTALVGIVTKLGKAGFTLGGDQVRTRPRGCPPDHPRLELMRHQSLTAHRRVAPHPRLASVKALDLVRTDWRHLRPLNDWVLDHVGPAGAAA
jgi:uncharacterized protein (TIGR02453 family)